MEFEITRRQGIVVWLYTLRQVKQLKRYGYIHYVSNRLKYVVLYVDKADAPEVEAKLNALHFVRKVELSHRPEVEMNFENVLAEMKREEKSEFSFDS